MKYLVLISLLLASTANATIDGPSCGDLTKKQEALFEGAARKYLEAKSAKNPKILKESLDLYQSDCHDYDGVHSTTEFRLTWTHIKNKKEYTCEQEIGIAVNSEGKIKIIDESSTFEIEIDEDPVCVKK